MAEEKKGVLGKAWDLVKEHMPSAKSMKKGAAVIGTAAAMTLAAGVQEVDAAPRKAPPLKPSHQMSMIQKQKKDFNDRIQVKQNSVVIKFGKSPNDLVKKENVKLWKPKRKNNKKTTLRMPGATQEENTRMAELNRIYGELHRQRGEAKFFKDEAEIERLTHEIRKIEIQRQEIRNAINARQKQSGREI